MQDLRVAKFGGSSVADATAMKRCFEIIAKRPQIKIVVVSATYNTTNQLEKMAAFAENAESENALSVLQDFKLRHMEIARELGVDASQTLDALAEEGKSLLQGIALLKECSPRTMDSLYALGERCSSALFATALNHFLKTEVLLKDARAVIKTNNNFGAALVDPMDVKANIHNYWKQDLERGCLLVTQGFIGSTADGITTTLGREGSDFSATLIGEAIEASSIEIWKDVTGIATTDPRIVSNVRFIPELSYSEMGELATLGAKVLHPLTLEPAERKNIPVFIGSSLAPDAPGTWIKNETKSKPLVQAITMREEQIYVTFVSKRRIPAHQFFAKIFSILSKHNIPLDLVNTHEKYMSFVMQPRTELSEELKKDLETWVDIQTEDHLAMVSIVGHGMSEAKGFMTKLFAFLESYRIRQLAFGTGRHGLSLMVSQEKARSLLKLLHHFFIEETDDEKRNEGPA